MDRTRPRRSLSTKLLSGVNLASTAYCLRIAGCPGKACAGGREGLHAVDGKEILPVQRIYIAAIGIDAADKLAVVLGPIVQAGVITAPRDRQRQAAPAPDLDRDRCDFGKGGDRGHPEGRVGA